MLLVESRGIIASQTHPVVLVNEILDGSEQWRYNQKATFWTKLVLMNAIACHVPVTTDVDSAVVHRAGTYLHTFCNPVRMFASRFPFDVRMPFYDAQRRQHAFMVAAVLLDNSNMQEL